MAEKSDCLNLYHGRKMHALSTVDVLVFSRKLKKYIGIKNTYETAVCGVSAHPQNRAFIPFELANSALENVPLLVYIGNNAQDVALVADKDSFWCPDLAIITGETTDVSVTGKSLHETLASSLADIIIPCPNSSSKLADTVEGETLILNVGFEALRLERIVDTLA